MAGNFTVRDSGLAVPAEKPQKRELFSIDVSYQQNVLSCLATIGREGATLIHVVQFNSGAAFGRKWRIFYEHTEELSMEVLC